MIAVIVEDQVWRKAEPKVVTLARRAAAAALASEGRKGADVTLLLADDVRLAGLNAAFRGKKGPTNVLSFPSPQGPDGGLGDVALAAGVCAQEARSQGKPLAHHLQHLVAHGVLHLLGYDHESDAEARIMEAKEVAILAGLGVPDPYAGGLAERPWLTRAPAPRPTTTRQARSSRCCRRWGSAASRSPTPRRPRRTAPARTSWTRLKRSRLWSSATS